LTFQHPYIPTTDAEEQEMLAAMGIKNFDELVKIIPDDLRLKEAFGLQAPKSEIEVAAELARLANRNRPATQAACFIGGGAYDHYTPAAVQAIAMRSEFYTAYTPYQAEVSQGTLQVMYEFQTMIAEISGFEVANASLYDGASAAAEACSMAMAITKKNRLLLPETVFPHTRRVIETYMQNRGAEIVTVASRNGLLDGADLKAKADGAACAIVQSPNMLGLVENWHSAREALGDALLIASADPLALGLLEAPGNFDADIYIGEGQSLGIPLSFGGPYLGLMATKKKYIRRMPGRIVGKTVDLDGRPAYTMVLRAREQDIRREKATSNICTNQGLMALWATIYLSLLGKQGHTKLARLCFDKSQYLGQAIDKLPGYEVPFGFGYVKEEVVRTPVPADELVAAADKADFNLATIEWQGEKLLQLAVTEQRTREEIDRLIEYLKTYN